MTGWIDHLVITPIILPLMASALMLAFDERRRVLKRVLSLATAALLIANAAALLWFSAPRVALGGKRGERLEERALRVEVAVLDVLALAGHPRRERVLVLARCGEVEVRELQHALEVAR